MNKCRLVYGLAVGIAVALGTGVLAFPVGSAISASPGSASAGEDCPESSSATEKVLVCEDFADGKPRKWSSSFGITDKDVSGGRLLLLNNFKEPQPGVEPTTQIVYQLWWQKGDITVEVKFDDFQPHENSRFQIDFQASPGNALDLGRYSAGGRQFIQYQVIGDSQSKIATEVDYAKNSGLMKAQYIAATGELRGFYKEAPEAEYTEMPGSPFVLPGFKKGPYLVVFYTHTFGPGGPSSVKLDWVKITTPAGPVIAADSSAAADSVAGIRETVLLFDDFNKKEAMWMRSEGATTEDIRNGRLLLVNKHPETPQVPSVPTSVTYSAAYAGDITAELKFDDFLPNENSVFQLQFMSPVPGNMVFLGRFSISGKQFIQFMVLEDSQVKHQSSVEYANNSGLLRATYVAKSGELRAFYKATAESEYTEMPGSPFASPVFKAPRGDSAYEVMVYAHKSTAPGGPASVKLDWVKITGKHGSKPNLAALGGAEQPRRPKNFKPFKFRYSTEALRKKYSDRTMKQAKKLMQRVDQYNQTGRYKPTWESLDTHDLPEWFADAKFGMFVDWGLYSIPAYAPTGYPDWYLHRSLYGDTRDYHEQVWGKDFRRDDFIPLFTAAEYDPEFLVKTAAAAGMKYVIPFAKHHDGFCLWPSSYTFRDAADMGPKRDLIGPIAEACRKRGLKFGFYFSLDEWEYPIIREDGKLAVRMWDTEPRGEIHTVPYSNETHEGIISGKIPVRDFHNDYINPQAIEFIDRYDPDIIWYDGEWVVGADERNSRIINAYFYNRAEGRKEVAINDRTGLCRLVPTLGQTPSDKFHGDFATSEALYAEGKDPDYKIAWEECMGLSHSFGYNWREADEHVKSTEQLIHMLVEVVSAGGNLLLITNLTPTGKLDPLLAVRLDATGDWLKVNGEAIYATRRWKNFKEGDSIRLTRSKDGKYVYAIHLNWPEKSSTLKSLRAKPGSTITMLGSNVPLPWRQDAGGLVIDIPDGLRRNKPCDFAWVLRIEAQPE